MEASIQDLAERVRAARASRTRLRIRAGGTKDFYGGPLQGELLDPRGHEGIVDYEPSELVVTARCGTRLAALETELAARGQMLAFEPPHFGDGATIGGCVAAGLAGPRRATAGGLRDFVLGAHLLDGRGELLRFGGTVMKNVAGYDVARLLAGSMGTLGVILQVSLKVLPRPPVEATLQLEAREADALDRMNAWGGQPLAISATCWSEGRLLVRLSGAQASIDAACRHIGGARIEQTVAGALWDDLREQRLAFFDAASPLPLWRLGLPSTAAPVALAGAQLIEWGGALRWLRTEETATAVRARAQALGGHATLFRGAAGGASHRSNAFTPLPAPLAAIHRRLKLQFDPDRLFNRSRLFAETDED